MKRLLISLSGILISLAAMAQSKKNDTLAILIIDRMTDVIGDLESCSFKLVAAHDVPDPKNGMIKYFEDYDVYMSGPDKLLINAHRHSGHSTLMYNGTQVAYYSFDENNYGVLPAPDNIIKMIDSLSDMYDIDFPAADFFYPAFTDDLLQQSDSLRYLGMERIGAKEYFHVIAYTREMTAQFWINNDAYNLPARFSITYKNKPGSPQYLALFSDWQINPQLPAGMFDFLPPPNAAQVRILSKKDK
ncbi:MAG TPA: DUF2092 domain-containing protein [Chitinophagaceae bacterium]|nr:DUF2092 domain-containing protein [Chitinophagaceae bacterium]